MTESPPPRGLSDREFLLGQSPFEPPPEQRPDEPIQSLTQAKIRVAGIMLTFCGSMGVMLGLFQVADSIMMFRDPTRLEEQLTQIREGMPEDSIFYEAMKEAPAMNASGVMIGVSIVFLIAAVVVLVGGLAIRKRRNYTFAIVSSLMALLPIPPVCCLSIPIGLWVFATLLGSDVREAFRSSP
ncbi:MAG TPA: hypothetical protein DDW52_08485 [Planctomycetaceae bacterium]|nr:hypothetical protein [Planctomycetaceae bacterium]